MQGPRSASLRRRGGCQGSLRCPWVLLSYARCAGAGREGAGDGGGVFGATRRSARRQGGKSLPRTSWDVQEFYLTLRSEVEAFALVSTSKPALRSLFRQRWRGDPNLGPLGPALSPGLLQSSFSFHFPTPSQPAALVEQLYWRVLRRRRASGGSSGGRPRLERPTSLRRRGRHRSTSLVREGWGASGLSRLTVCVTGRGAVSGLGSGERGRKLVS